MNNVLFEGEEAARPECYISASDALEPGPPPDVAPNSEPRNPNLKLQTPNPKPQTLIITEGIFGP